MENKKIKMEENIENSSSFLTLAPRGASRQGKMKQMKGGKV
jgi:hypothetical protein